MGCADCGLKFNNLFRRRHHCRLCGDLFCKSCVVQKRLESYSSQLHDVATAPTIKICRGCAYNHDSNSPTLTGSGASATMMSMFHRRSLTKQSATKRHVKDQLSKSCRGRLVTAPFAKTTDTHVHPLVVPTAESQAQADERRRVRAVKKLNAATIDNLTILCDTCAAFELCPMAYVTLIDDTTQHIKASVGFGALASKARGDADLCDWVVTTAEPLVVLDAAQDLRFRHTSLVVDWSIRFYAGVPLVDDKGWVVGTLAIMDTVPHTSCDVLPLKAMASGALLALCDLRVPTEGGSHDSATNLHSMPRPHVLLATPTTLSPRSATNSPSPRRRSPTACSPFDGMDASLSSRMLNVLNTSTNTQLQLAQQQGHLAHTMSNHSDMISRLALAIERMESKLASPLNLRDSSTPTEGA
ncbi:hypothetical protein DYB32_009000 [Aphanomyces invadans]|nr:hypothetical protein DYB32_009000 [Aphanomyces invadans]